MKLKEHLAVEVMGWVRGKLTAPHSGTYYCDSKNEKIWIDWDPIENIEQAFMLLDKFEQWGISCNLIDNGYFVSIIEWPKEGRDQEWEAEDKSLPIAICLAVGKATGWKDE